ncbi:MAG: rane dipeptidase [Patescibacteria group bacterium]|nr:rane dipeptidase [Patescibacteria group bacterium]
MKIIDLHQDILIHQDNQNQYKYKNQTSLDQIMNSDIRVVFGTGFVFGENDNFFAQNCMELIEQDIDRYIGYSKVNTDFVIIKSDNDLALVVNDAMLSPKKGVIFHIEGLNTFEDTRECWDFLQRMYEKGLRSIGIVWTLENSLGGGNDSNPDCGLTPLGEEVIRWAFEHGVLVDYAHMNDKTFSDVLSIATEQSTNGKTAQPIFISHGNAKSVCNNNRNYSDDQLAKVKESDGIMGVFFANNCLVSEGLATIEDVVKHIVYIRELIGIDHIAIGSDLGGLSLNIPEGLRNILSFDNLKEALLKVDFSDDDTEKIFYKNAYRFLKLSFKRKSSIMQ